MKNSLLLFLLIGLSATAFGQSKKAINKQLRAKLSVAKQTYDSSVTVYLAKYNELEKLRKDIRVKQIRDIDMKRKDNRGKLDNALLNHQHLMQLGFDANTLVSSETLRAVTLPESQSVVDGIKNALTDVFSFRKISDSLNLDGLKIKNQNYMITAKLEEYSKALAENTVQLNRADGFIAQLKDATAQLDAISKTYDNLHFSLGDYDKLLQKKILELKEDYRKRGPKGFPPAYQRLFPNEHRVTSDIKGWDYGDSDPMPEPPMPVEQYEAEIYQLVEETAEFPGGITAMNAYLEKNLKYPPMAREMELSGKCYLRFVVSKEGKISDVKVLKGIADCKECDAEAIRLVKAMPNWKPGKNKGKAVDSYFTIPVKFSLK